MHFSSRSTAPSGLDAFFWSTKAKAWARFPRPFGPTVRVYSAKTVRADCAGLFCQDRSGRLCGPILPRPFGPTMRVFLLRPFGPTNRLGRLRGRNDPRRRRGDQFAHRERLGQIDHLLPTPVLPTLPAAGHEPLSSEAAVSNPNVVSPAERRSAIHRCRWYLERGPSLRVSSWRQHRPR